jgi:hypothetical protein
MPMTMASSGMEPVTLGVVRRLMSPWGFREGSASLGCAMGVFWD